MIMFSILSRKHIFVNEVQCLLLQFYFNFIALVLHFLSTTVSHFLIFIVIQHPIALNDLICHTCIGWSDVTIICGHITISMLWGNTA